MRRHQEVREATKCEPKDLAHAKTDPVSLLGAKVWEIRSLKCVLSLSIQFVPAVPRLLDSLRRCTLHSLGHSVASIGWEIRYYIEYT